MIHPSYLPVMQEIDLDDEESMEQQLHDENIPQDLLTVCIRTCAPLSNRAHAPAAVEVLTLLPVGHAGRCH
jgi:hypothetical protein